MANSVCKLSAYTVFVLGYLLTFGTESLARDLQYWSSIQLTQKLGDGFSTQGELLHRYSSQVERISHRGQQQAGRLMPVSSIFTVSMPLPLAQQTRQRAALSSALAHPFFQAFSNWPICCAQFGPRTRMAQQEAGKKMTSSLWG
jgi:hypothetical protein